MYFIYILYSESYDRYYIGYSSDVHRRLVEHNNNPRMTYTHKFRPWQMKAFYPVSDIRTDAIKLERYIKKQKSRKFNERLISDSGYFYKIAQLGRVPTCRD